MCHDDDSLPPRPPSPGPVLRHGRLELEAADGNRFPAYEAVAEKVTRGNLIVLPDRRGLHPFYYRLTQEFAAAGFHAVAFDFYARTAGPGERGEGFGWDEHFPRLRPEHVLADARAVARHLRAANDAPLMSVGFCLGGSHSWRLAASDLGLAGAIGLYGMPAMVSDIVGELNAPIQLHVAGHDHVSSVSDFESLAARLDELGKPYDMQVYDGAPHAYFDEHFTEWADACTNTWTNMLSFADQCRS
jgi:carboxymethylenebutenolidase